MKKNRSNVKSHKSERQQPQVLKWNSSLSYAAVEYALVQYPAKIIKSFLLCFRRDYFNVMWCCFSNSSFEIVCVCWSLCSHLFEAFFFAHGVCDTLDLIPFTAWLSFQFSVYLPRRLPLSRNWQCKPTMLALARRYCTGFFKKLYTGLLSACIHPHY